MIGRRISDLSSNKEVFEAEVAVYSSALKASGYNNEPQYTEKTVAKKISEEKCDLVQPAVEWWGQHQRRQEIPKHDRQTLP